MVQLEHSPGRVPDALKLCMVVPEGRKKQEKESKAGKRSGKKESRA